MPSTGRSPSSSFRFPGRAIALYLATTISVYAGTSPALDLSIGPTATNNWLQLRVAGATNVAWTIEASQDLNDWRDIARLHALDNVLFWTDPTILFFQDAAAPEHARFTAPRPRLWGPTTTGRTKSISPPILWPPTGFPTGTRSAG